jgi:hypothetical protein
MTIKFDGAEFSSVEELIAYKKALGQLPEPKVYQAPVKPDVAPEAPKQPLSEPEAWQELGRILKQVEDEKKAHPNRRRNQKAWSKQDNDYLRANYKRLPLAELAADLGRSPNAVKVQAFNQGLCTPRASPSKSGARFSVEEDSMIREVYKSVPEGGRVPKKELNVLARKLKRTPDSVTRRAWRLKQSPYMKRRSPVVPQEYDKAAAGMAAKAVTARVDEFPSVFPVDDGSLPMLEQLLRYAVANKGKVTLFDVQSAVQIGLESACYH